MKRVFKNPYVEFTRDILTSDQIMTLRELVPNSNKGDKHQRLKTRAFMTKQLPLIICMNSTKLPAVFGDRLTNM